jgi:putative flavoprotein involved in K+ transport
MTDVTPTARAAAWLSCLGDALAASDIGAAVALFGSECYWRDLLTFTWNIKTMEGHEAIIRMLEATLAATAPSAWTIVEDATETDGVVEAWFTFETGVARGKGHLRLRGDRGWTFLTTMTELKGREERRGVTRENGVAHGASRDRPSWLERKRAHEAALGHTVQPYCVVIGGGQGGIALGARLKPSAFPPSSSRRMRGPAIPGATGMTHSCSTTRSGTTTCPTCLSPITGPFSRPRTRWATG